MAELLLNSVTDKDVKRYLAKPAQFLIISGPAGNGKLTLALMIGSEMMGQELAAEHPAVLHLSVPANKSEIPIDQVREAISKLKLTTTGRAETRRLLLIEDGHYLSEEAQNALLKTLEEPPADTQIIMTVDAPGSILPTIISRGQLLETRPVELEAAKSSLVGRYKSDDIQKAWLLSDGSPGLMSALLEQSGQHELKSAVDDAKSFIAASRYQRLSRANEFTKNRRQLELLIIGLQKIVKTAQKQAISAAKPANHNKITAARKQLDELSDALRANVSPKTVYLKLCLNLGV